MKTQMIGSTFALIISLYGIPPALAESFNDRGMDWITASPTLSTAYPGNPQTLTPDGSFASSWNSGITPLQYRDPTPSSTRADMGQSCDLKPRVGFNKASSFPTC